MGICREEENRCERSRNRFKYERPQEEGLRTQLHICDIRQPTGFGKRSRLSRKIPPKRLSNRFLETELQRIGANEQGTARPVYLEAGPQKPNETPRVTSHDNRRHINPPIATEDQEITFALSALDVKFPLSGDFGFPFVPLRVLLQSSLSAPRILGINLNV